MGQGKEFGPYITNALNDAGALILLLLLELNYTFKSELELVVIELEHSSSSFFGLELENQSKNCGGQPGDNQLHHLAHMQELRFFPFGPPTL